METTATYDVNTKEFILNTPDINAYKWWVGIVIITLYLIY